MEHCLNEEEKAEKALETSYVMLHIYWNNSEEIEDINMFQARIVSTDLVISDTLRLLRSITNHDALYSLMKKLVLLRGKAIHIQLNRPALYE